MKKLPRVKNSTFSLHFISMKPCTATLLLKNEHTKRGMSAKNENIKSQYQNNIIHVINHRIITKKW